MPRILKIDNFTKEHKSNYGLDSGGTCYMVKEPFYLEIIQSYDIDKIQVPQTLKMKWGKIKVSKGDIISVTDSGCFVELEGYNGFVECRPEKIEKSGEPSFSSLPGEYLKKLGKDMINSVPMSFEDRNKVIITRI